MCNIGGLGGKGEVEMLKGVGKGSWGEFEVGIGRGREGNMGNGVDRMGNFG